ncbi:hypothetical protein QBC45DRAFT_478427 [Copromyces sp. CBS 386.78]|nr:hypothetical protein QBC45DRAFT_478427 [Copromyces sp. CBS 386.78]
MLRPFISVSYPTINAALLTNSKRKSTMGILCCLPTRRQRHLLPKGHTICSWASHLTSTSTSIPPSPSILTTTTTININARLASCLNQLDQLFGRHHDPTRNSPPCPTRRPPPSPQTSDNAPCAPPLYTALSSSADLNLPSYADLLNLGAALISPCRHVTPREPPPSFEAAEMQEHEDLHGSDPFRWPGCEYCRGYALWVCYWRGVREVMGGAAAIRASHTRPLLENLVVCS